MIPSLPTAQLQAVGCCMLWWHHSQLLATKHLSVSTTLRIVTGEVIEDLRNCVTCAVAGTVSGVSGGVGQCCHIACTVLSHCIYSYVTLHVQCCHITCTSFPSKREIAPSGNLK
jgi:hypothetical protein